MKVQPIWRRPYVAHAARVAAVATIIIAALYVGVVASFDAIDHHRLVGQIDAQLSRQIGQVVEHPQGSDRGRDRHDGSHDADDVPVFLWSVTKDGTATALTANAPTLTGAAWSPSKQSLEAQLAPGKFRLKAQRIGPNWLVAGQSMANVDRVESDLVALEAIAGPLLIITVFLGTFLIGIKAAGPVELARQRQLEFTADASHELRTPLSVIEAEVSLSLNAPRSGDDYRATLLRVNRESARLRDIVGDLLWLARFDAEPPPPADQPVDVGAIASACAARFSPVAERDNITLVVSDTAECSPWINAPPEWIDRLTAVLVDNACRYAGVGGIVRISVAVVASRVALVVDDSGPGIAAEERHKLFDRFHRATDEGNGAGLGLAIADSVAHATGGEWRVGDSDLGGAHMEVRWHLAPGARGPGDHTSSARDTKHEPSPTGEPVIR